MSHSTNRVLTRVLPPLGVDFGLDGVQQFGEPLNERLFPTVVIRVGEHGGADGVEFCEGVDDGRQLPQVVAVVVILQLEP